MPIWRPKPGGRGPRYLQIVEAMAGDIADGRLPPGARLPPYRELAYALGLSAQTVGRAYAEGVRRGLLRGEVGRGTFVRTPGGQLADGAPGDLLRDAVGPIDLSRNLPLPGAAEGHLRRVLATIAAEPRVHGLLDYQTGADLAGHTAAALAWLRLCGVAAAAANVVLANGAQHGVFCTLMALLRPGDLLLTEALSYAPVRVSAERLGLSLLPVAMDAGGLCPEAFDAACRTGAAKALYLTPTLQTPTTVTLSAERRSAIAVIARRHGVTLIEDDVFGLLKPDRPPPIAALAPERTIYVTSVSKCVAPGLRVGYLSAPEPMAPALRQAVNLSVWMTPPMTAEVCARLVNDGTAEALIREQRAAGRRRQALARAVLAGHDVTADPHGLHLWLALPGRWRSDAFRAEAARQGVLVTEARAFAAPGAGAPEAVRLCLSHEASEARLEQGLTVIAGLLRTPPVAAGVFL